MDNSDNGYKPSEGIRRLAGDSGYSLFNLGIDISGKTEAEIARLKARVERLGAEIKNKPIMLREGDMLAVFCKGR